MAAPIDHNPVSNGPVNVTSNPPQPVNQGDAVFDPVEAASKANEKYEARLAEQSDQHSAEIRRLQEDSRAQSDSFHERESSCLA